MNLLDCVRMLDSIIDETNREINEQEENFAIPGNPYLTGLRMKRYAIQMAVQLIRETEEWKK